VLRQGPGPLRVSGGGTLAEIRVRARR
jgi:hypothetical protein